MPTSAARSRQEAGSIAGKPVQGDVSRRIIVVLVFFASKDVRNVHDPQVRGAGEMPRTREARLYIQLRSTGDDPSIISDISAGDDRSTRTLRMDCRRWLNLQGRVCRLAGYVWFQRAQAGPACSPDGHARPSAHGEYGDKRCSIHANGSKDMCKCVSRSYHPEFPEPPIRQSNSGSAWQNGISRDFLETKEL